MPRRGSAYGPIYQRERAQMLARPRLCVHRMPGCGYWASEADHVPALVLHKHRNGSGCCRLVPSCGPCARRQGAMLQGASVLVDGPIVEVVDIPELVGLAADHSVWDSAGWLAELREVPADAVWPRLMTLPHPAAVGSYGAEFDGWCRRVRGLELRWWQRLVAYRLLEHDSGGVLVWMTLLLSLARQLGKSTLLAALFLWRLTEGERLFGERQTLLYTARDLAVSREVQFETRLWAKAALDGFGEPVYKVTEANGKEAIEHLATHSRWLLRAEKAVYGVSAAVVAVDEAWDIQASTVDEGIEPTLVERAQPQLLLVSTAHRQATVLMPGRRAAALAALDGVDTSDLLVEWSPASNVDIQDRSAWRSASPHWTVQREKLIGSKVAKALAGESDDPTEPDPVEAIYSQWFNRWPLKGGRGGRGELLVDGDVWARALEDLTPVGPVVVAVEDWFGQSASVAAAGLSEDGVVVVGGHCFDDRAKAFEWAVSVFESVPGSVLLAGATLVDEPGLDLVPVERRGAGDVRTGLASFRALLAVGKLRHDGLGDVGSAIGGARVSPAASGGLALLNVGRVDLVRAVVCAVDEAHRMAGLVSTVYGGQL